LLRNSHRRRKKILFYIYLVIVKQKFKNGPLITTVVSNRPLHRAMQQRCHHASASARSPSWPPIPHPHLQRAATARREKVQLPIAEQNFSRNCSTSSISSSVGTRTETPSGHGWTVGDLPTLPTDSLIIISTRFQYTVPHGPSPTLGGLQIP
jgi:hypothetical protein